MFFEKKVHVGVKEGPFVGEEIVMLFLEVGMLVRVVEVVVKVLVAMVDRRGLPQDAFFLGTFSLLPPLHCPFSSDLSLSPSLQPFWLSF